MGYMNRMFALLKSRHAAGGGSDSVRGGKRTDHDFLGCIGLSFSKNVRLFSGEVLLNGEKTTYLVKKLRIIADIKACMLGVRLTGRILEGDGPATLTISGFILITD